MPKYTIVKKYHEIIKYAESIGFSHAQAVLAKSKTKKQLYDIAMQKKVVK